MAIVSEAQIQSIAATPTSTQRNGLWWTPVRPGLLVSPAISSTMMYSGSHSDDRSDMALSSLFCRRGWRRKARRSTARHEQTTWSCDAATRARQGVQ